MGQTPPLTRQCICDPPVSRPRSHRPERTAHRQRTSRAYSRVRERPRPTPHAGPSSTCSRTTARASRARCSPCAAARGPLRQLSACLPTAVTRRPRRPLASPKYARTTSCSRVRRASLAAACTRSQPTWPTTWRAQPVSVQRPPRLCLRTRRNQRRSSRSNPRRDQRHSKAARQH